LIVVQIRFDNLLQVDLGKSLGLSQPEAAKPGAREYFVRFIFHVLKFIGLKVAGGWGVVV
jgi:hypothetical protein